MSDQPVIVLGAGGHAKVLIDALHRLSIEILFAVESEPGAEGRTVLDVPILGGEQRVLGHSPESVRLVNGVGSVSPGAVRQVIFHRFAEAGYRFAQVVHPGATIGAGVALGHGVQVMAGAVVQADTSVGDNVILNTRSSVDHDCKIGRHVHIAPGVTLSGGVEVGDDTHIGVGATVLQGVRIGRGCMVAAGAVVVRDVVDGAKVAGVPSREVGK